MIITSYPCLRQCGSYMYSYIIFTLVRKNMLSSSYIIRRVKAIPLVKKYVWCVSKRFDWKRNLRKQTLLHSAKLSNNLHSYNQLITNLNICISNGLFSSKIVTVKRSSGCSKLILTVQSTLFWPKINFFNFQAKTEILCNLFKKLKFSFKFFFALKKIYFVSRLHSANERFNYGGLRRGDKFNNFMSKKIDRFINAILFL